MRMRMRMNNFLKNNIVKDGNIKESIEKPKEIKSPNWFDKNRFRKILAIIDSNKFTHLNKIGDFKYIDIKDLVNKIKNNTISETDAKKSLNALNKIKNKEIKYKKLIPKQRELLNLFNDLLDTILTDKTLESKIQKDENDETLMSSNEDDKNDKTLMSSNEADENDEASMSSKDGDKNAKNKKTSTNTKKDEKENMLLEYMEDVDDKLFKE